MGHELKCHFTNFKCGHNDVIRMCQSEEVAKQNSLQSNPPELQADVNSEGSDTGKKTLNKKQQVLSKMSRTVVVVAPNPMIRRNALLLRNHVKSAANKDTGHECIVQKYLQSPQSMRQLLQEVSEAASPNKWIVTLKTGKCTPNR